MLDFIRQPWPWYVAGPVISLVMFGLLLFGNNLGISSNLRTLCSVFGAGKHCEFFDFEWKKQTWNLVFVLGLILGGVLSNLYLTNEVPIELSEATVSELEGYGLSISNKIIPTELFNWEELLTLRGFIMLVVGGFLVGFGTRYAGGCTSGHAISGLSNLQLPSLIAVIGFFIGGLAATHFILPFIL